MIFVALALLWAVFLIPRALRSHDEAARPQSVETTSDHARVLSRREAPAQADVAEAAPAPEVPEQRRPTAQELVARQRRLARSAARRRRRVLAFLLLATVAVGVLAATGVLLPWAPAIPAGVVVGFLALARVTVRREHRRWEAVRARIAAAPPVAEVAAPEAAAAAAPEVELHVVPAARNEQGVAVVSDLEDTSAYSAEVLAEAVGRPSDPTLWDPLPVTLPTYVGKPRATRSVRTIDLNAPGVSSSGRNAADSALVAETATAGADSDVPGQRAVGS